MALLLLAGGTTQASAQISNFSLSDLKFTGTFGLEYSNGSYGTKHNTNVEMGLPVLSVEADDFKLTASMPYLRISGRGLLIFDAAGNPVIVNRRTTLPADVRTGFGDLNLSATYSVPSSILDGFEVKLTSSVKLSTASVRRRLSTGETDFGVSADISHPFGSWTPFMTVGYLWAGSSPIFTLYNTTSVSAGTSYEVSDNLVAVASYDYDSSGNRFITSSKEVFGSLSWIRDNGMTLTGYGTAGLSNGSPRFGAGLLISYGLN
jgi:hypothetical protein